MSILFGRRIGVESGFTWWICIAVVCVLAGGLSIGQSRSQATADPALQHMELGNAKYRSGDFTGAIKEYTETIRIDPENVLEMK